MLPLSVFLSLSCCQQQCERDKEGDERTFSVVPHLVGIWCCKGLLSTQENIHAHTHTHTHSPLAVLHFLQLKYKHCQILRKERGNIIIHDLVAGKHITKKKTSRKDFLTFIHVMSSFSCFAFVLYKPTLSFLCSTNVPEKATHIIGINVLVQCRS